MPSMVQLFESLSGLFHPLAFLTFCLSLFYLYKRFQCVPCAGNKLPPSPPRFPVIGNLHQLGSYPYRSLQSLSQTYGHHLMLMRLGSTPALIVSSAEAAREVMKVHDVCFSDRPHRDIFAKLLYNCRDIAAAPYGEYWRQMRSVFVLHLSSNTRVRSYAKVREEEVALIVENIKQQLSVSSEEAASVNLSKMLMCFTNDVISRVAYGKKYEEKDRDAHKRSLDGLNELLGGFYFVDYVPWLAWIDRLLGIDAKAEKVRRDFDELLTGIVKEHRDRQDHHHHADNKERSDGKMKDFADVLLELQRDETLGFTIDDESLKAMLLDTFVGGTDTTYTAIEWTMSELLRNPTIMKRLQEEVRGIMGSYKEEIKQEDLEKMKYLKAVIKEALRLHPPLPLLVPRQTTQPVKLMGYDIPKGTQVITNAWAIQRDPRYWDQPEEFRPERFLGSDHIELGGQNFHLIPFGAGRRGCPGILFALANDELVLANLVNKFDWALPGGAKCESLDMAEVNALTVHRKAPLVVVPSLPSSSSSSSS